MIDGLWSILFRMYLSDAIVNIKWRINQMMKKSHRQVCISDMTTGDPIRLILTFAVPLFIGNIFQQIYTMVDTMVVGHMLGDGAISAIGATSAIYSLMITLSSGMNNGYAIIATQAFGAHDDNRLRRSIAGIFILNVASTVLVTLLAVAFLRPILEFMNTPVGIFEDSYNYILVLCIGLFSTIGYNMFAGILRAVGNSRTPLNYLILSSVINVVLDLLLVGSMGVIGAALATVIAQVVSAVCCGISFFRNCRNMIPSREDFKQCRMLLPPLLSAGTAMALMLCVVNLGSLIFQRANNSLGEAVITAHTSAHKIFTVFLQPISTIATATSTFVSQNWGAKQYERIRVTLKKVLWLEVIWGVFSCVVVYATGDWLIRILTGTEDPDILSNAVMAMRISLPFFPILGVLQCLRTAMQSMGYKNVPVMSSCIELIMKILGAILLIPSYGYFGACITEPLTWTAMTAFLVCAYFIRRKKIYGEA